jgi:glycosyltransferase involved in cell wall biosynthesis/predicted GH43/DUF377 family glycosyl hydrolase
VIFSVTITDNREDKIAGAIRSVVDHVDRVLLIDTGITDRTIERAREVAGDKIIVTEHVWVDFSRARNAAIATAMVLGAEWIIIVDSDERFDFGVLDLRAALANTRADVLTIESLDGHYPKEKILRAASSLYFIGPTHETLPTGSREKLDGATFCELGKTSEEMERKFTRDVALLSDYTEKHPEDPRWWYYLGSSYEGIGDHARAAEAFGEHVRRRRLGDEAAWGAYKQAEQLFILERFEEAVEAAARGMGADATFAECAWVAAVASWRLGRPAQAVAWARIAESVGLYKGCGSNREYFKYPPALYELPYDVLREALPDEADRKQADEDFHAAKRARVGATDDHDLDRLSVSLNTPEPKRDEIRAMLRPPRLDAICPSAVATKIQLDLPDGRWPMNPSICWHEGELLCVVRVVNYTITGRQYVINDADGIVRTENYLGVLRADGELIEPRLIRDLDPAPRQESQIVGYEDIRLVSIKGKTSDVLTGSATVCDRDPDGRRLIARLYLSPLGDVKRAEVQPSNQLHEKNWMPLSVGGKFAWIYSIDPTAILPGPLRSCPLALEHLRGGAAIEFEDGYLCVTHEVIDADEGRIYLHRFVRLDDEFNVTTVSPAWIFTHYGIEFAAGLARDGTTLVLSYGVDDREAWIVRVDVKEVEKMQWIKP